jgi:YidC/Oxa1 family membrane protein insertase
MESQRLILFFVFAFSLFMLFDAWQREQHPPTRPAPAAPAEKDASVPPIPADMAAPTAVPTPAPSAQAPASAPTQSATVSVETDVFRAEISTIGGDLRRLEFKQHRAVDDKNKNFVLFDQRPDHVYVAQSGLLGGKLPTHRTEYFAAAKEYKLADGSNTVEVRLTAPPADGVNITKVYRFTRGSYLIDVSFEIENKGGAALQPYGYFQVLRDDKAPAGDSAMLPTFTGVGVYTDKEKFQKVVFADIEKGKAQHVVKSEDGWIAMLQHYFLAAWLPKNGTPREFYTRKVDNNLFAAGVIVPGPAVQPGSSATLAVPLYAAPEEQDKLSKLAPGLDLSIDYGWLTVIAVPLFWLLSWFYQWVGNWGIAIILLTVVIKLIFYPLSEASYRSMAKMRVLAPKMQRLKCSRQ